MEIPFSDFNVDCTGLSLTDRCLYESYFNDRVMCYKDEPKVMRYLYTKCKSLPDKYVCFNRYDSFIKMIWQNVVEKLGGFYLTNGGYIYSIKKRTLVNYYELNGKRYYRLNRIGKKVYDINKREWV